MKPSGSYDFRQVTQSQWWDFVKMATKRCHELAVEDGVETMQRETGEITAIVYQVKWERRFRMIATQRPEPFGQVAYLIWREEFADIIAEAEIEAL